MWICRSWLATGRERFGMPRCTWLDAISNASCCASAIPKRPTLPGIARRSCQVNVVVLTQLTKLLLPPMVARRRGRVLNVATTAAFQPGPLMAVYYATKAYVLSFSEAIADELRDSGVTVTALCPGPLEPAFAAGADMTTTRLSNVAKPMSSADVARAGYAAMKRGRRVVIPGVKNKLLTQSVRVSPRRLVTTIVRKLQESRQ